MRADAHGRKGCAEEMASEELHNFESCSGRPISMNSVLDAFKDRRLVLIDMEIEEILLSK